MRRSFFGILFAVLAAAATAQGVSAPSPDRQPPNSGAHTDQGGPARARDPKDQPRPIPAARPTPIVSMTSLDYALPKLSDDERAFALTDGYVYTIGPMRFLHKGQEIDELSFMSAIGMDSYVESMKMFKKWNTVWIAATCALAAGLAAEFILSDDGSGSITSFEWGTTIALCVSFTGGSIHYMARPRLPYFQTLAYKVNEANRKLMSE
jgi:hypothetical protein